MTPALHRAGLRLLVSAVALAAIALFVMSSLTLSNYPSVVGLCLLVLAGSALRSPHGPTQGASLASIVLVSVYVIAGPAAAVVVAGIGSLVQARRVPWIKRVFNSGQRILSAAGGALAYLLMD